MNRNQTVYIYKACLSNQCWLTLPSSTNFQIGSGARVLRGIAAMTVETSSTSPEEETSWQAETTGKGGEKSPGANKGWISVIVIPEIHIYMLGVEQESLEINVKVEKLAMEMTPGEEQGRTVDDDDDIVIVFPLLSLSLSLHPHASTK